MKYKIGDSVWYAKYRTEEERVVCPDCCGKKQLLIIMGDETKIDLPCPMCETRNEYGYDSFSSGYVKIYRGKPSVEKREITGIEKNCDGEIEYKLQLGGCSYYTATENGLCDSKEEAEKQAQILADEAYKKELDKIENRKHDNKRTWAWNASYHRKQIKEGERSIEYHKKKLNIASTKSKETK